MSRRAFAVLVLYTAGCSSKRAPAPLKTEPIAPVVVATVSEAGSTSSAPELPAPPAPAEGSVQELEAIVMAMCAATYREDDGKRTLGCRRPPPFKGAGRQPDGKMARFEGDDPTTFCPVSIAARGAFSAPDKKETLVTIDNCRDEDSDEGWNGSVPGSAAVVANEDGKWHAVTAAKGVNTGDCSVIRRADRRDALICRSRYDAGSIGTDHYFFFLDFAGGTPMARTVAHVFDDVEMWTCAAHDGQGAMAPTGLTRVKSVSLMTRDINGDGTPDIILDVERAHAEPSAALDAKLRTLCKQGKPIDAVLPAPAKHKIEILSDGTRFRPNPAAKALLERWRKESPDVTQLEEAAPPKVDR